MRLRNDLHRLLPALAAAGFVLSGPAGARAQEASAPAAETNAASALEKALQGDAPPPGPVPPPAVAPPTGEEKSAGFSPQPTEPAAPPSWADVRASLIARADALHRRLVRSLPPRAREGVLDLRTLTFSDEARRVVIHVLVGLLLFLLIARIVRGRGDVVVTIEYPPELRGTFTVRARKARWTGRPSRVASASDAARSKRKARTASRTQHPMVARETRFTGLPARSYTVTVDGFLQSPGENAVVTSHVEEREIRLRRGRTERVEFDFHPKHCPVDVKVTWDRRQVPDAFVAIRNLPGSLRYVRGGPVRLGVPIGTHTVLVGSADRVAEQTLEIESFQPAALEIELADREMLLFSGCPPAVEPYLHGDVPAAAGALERDGQTQVSNLLLAFYHRDHDRPEAAAGHFEAAGRYLDAARLRESLSEFESAAALYERAGEIERAAEMFRSAGDLVRAGEAYEQARQFQTAVECFQQASDVGRWVEALEKYGSPFQAAKVAIEHEEWGRAIRCLQQVTSQDPQYLEAAELLVDAYQREGHLDLAVRKIEEVVARKGEDHVPLEACDRLAELLEKSGEIDRALDVLELVRRRDATWPNLATRIEELRKIQSKERGTMATALVGVPAAESRYEILEEVGRGGMGIVFKARDRRLGRVVALKRLPDNLRNHPKAVELFLREARAAAALNHGNIVTLFDAGQEADTYYITMELLEGHPVQRILKSRTRFSVRDAAKLGAQIANGLQYAHDRGVVHRDIKTGNLFFTNDKVVKIMDFGLAKMVEEVRRSTTVIGGTPYYMAPEQSVGGAVDHRVDIYALGVTLFEFLTGKVPFDDGDVAYHHRHTPPPDPRERAEGIPDELAELILHMLAKNRDDRCGSARRVAERLQDLLK